MSAKIYIDGQAGTTALRIREWLADRDDLTILTLPEADRKNPEARRAMLQQVDVGILCLPDDAAREVAEWMQGRDTRIIDASTAHRVAEGWVYGLPELVEGQRDAIRNSQRISNPGCYSSSSILMLRPLLDAGLLQNTAAVSIHALSGNSGGGRALIERWQDPEGGLSGLPFEAPYAYAHTHKHIPEMMTYTGLAEEPQFLPAVGPFRCGMRVQVALHKSQLQKGAGRAVWETLVARYEGESFVKVMPLVEASDIHELAFDPRACNDTNRIELRVVPHPSGHVTVMAILDNLGKGASGMAVQSLNLLLDQPETTSLPLYRA